jgi:hypothetical protein
MVRHLALPDRARSRLIVCTATVIACVPYLALKLAWVLGVPVGLDGTAFLDTTRAANVMTLGVQLTAVAVVVLVTHPLGEKLPAAVVVIPAWIATGVLAPVGLGVVAGAPLQLATGGDNPFGGDEVLAWWVFALVYGGFIAQAILLPTAFVLHALQRWPGWASRATLRLPSMRTRSLQDLLAVAFVLGALVFVGQQLRWMVAGGGSFSNPDTSQRVFLGASALLVAGGAVAELMVLRRRAITRSVLVLAWLGTGVVFCSTLMEAVKALALDAAGWGASSAGPVDASFTLLVLITAVAGTTGAAFQIVEHVAAASDDLPVSYGFTVGELDHDVEGRQSQAPARQP